MFNSFRVPKYYGPHLTSRWFCLGLLWPLGPGPFPMTSLSLILAFIHLIMNQSLNHSYQAQKKSFFGLKDFNKALHTCALVANCSLQRALRTLKGCYLAHVG